jgi:hypothetical protein
MKIYVAHATNFDYVNEIYKPIREDILLKNYEIVLPHEEENYLHDRDYYNDFDIAICEVSYPSTGLGIELGFLYDGKTKIYAFYKKGCNYSKSILAITKELIEYDNKEDFINKVKNIIKGE